MVEERRPTKKVVKKVVKKTVPRKRAARPVARPASKSASSAVSTRPKATAAARPNPAVRRPSFDLGSRVGTVRSRGAGAARGAGDRVRDGFAAVADGSAKGFDAVRSARLPTLASWQGATITGLLVGLIAVTLGWASAALFTATRGTSSGGGWGTLALVVVAFVAFFVGELLLDGFGAEQARVTSFLGVVIAFVVILIAFLELAQGRAAWILVPVLGALAFVAADRLVTFAADQPTQQR